MELLLRIIIAAFPELVLLALGAVVAIGGVVCIGIFLVGGASLLFSGVTAVIGGIIQKIKNRRT